MKEIHNMLEELNSNASKDKSELEKKYRVKEHPAKELDEYMKEQYVTMLFSMIKESEQEESAAVSFIFYISEQIDYSDSNDNIVKNVYKLDDKKINDCIVSFENEEIRYLLSLDILLTVSLMNEKNNAGKTAEQFIKALSISDDDLEEISGIRDVIENSSLNAYNVKRYNQHSLIYNCYLHVFDFSKERTLVYSNCIGQVRTSDCARNYKQYEFMSFAQFAEAYMDTPYKIRECQYVEKGTSLGHFIVRVFGFSMGMCSEEDWKKCESDENNYLKTPKFKTYEKYLDDYYENNTYEMVDIIAEKSGALFMYCTCIDLPNLPFAIISHPLDNIEKAEDLFAEKYEELFN